MSEKVWISNIARDLQKTYSIGFSIPNKLDYPKFNELDNKKRSNNLSESEWKTWCDYVDNNFDPVTYWQGQAITKSEMPNELYIEFSDEQIPSESIFKAIGKFMIINQTFAKVLKQHTLGNTQLSEAYLYNLNREKLSETPFYFLNIAETRDYFSPEHTPKLDKMSHEYNDKPVYLVNSYPEHNEISVFDRAKNCNVDIWLEPNYDEAIFFSDKLVQSLITAGIQPEDCNLYQCNMITTN